jgi:nitroreductase
MSQGETAADVADVLRSRRSINLFEPEPVDRALLLDAIEAARWAPNHRLTEPWRFYVLGEDTAEAIARLAAQIETAAKGERVGAARYERLKSIPGNFVVTSQRSDDELLDRENYAACCCAVQNLMLYLWPLGVGVKWTTGGMTREQAFYDLLGIDAAREDVVGFFWYGRPKVVPTQRRREVAEIVIEKP